MKIESYVLPIGYFPPLDFWSIIISDKNILLDLDSNYQKRSILNRMFISTSSGPLMLSIPLAKGKNEAQNVMDLKISYDQNWQKLHLNAFESNYGKSAFYDCIKDDLINFYSNQPSLLIDWNCGLINLIAEWLSIDFEMKFTEGYKLPQYNYIDFDKNVKADLKINYPSNYNGSSMNFNQLSVLDLVCKLGRESIQVLKPLSLSY